jgi:hypothetical protein
MTALQELIQYLGASNPMDYSYFLEKERGQIADAYSDGAEAQRDSRYLGMEEYLKKVYKNK